MCVRPLGTATSSTHIRDDLVCMGEFEIWGERRKVVPSIKPLGKLS